MLKVLVVLAVIAVSSPALSSAAVQYTCADGGSFYIVVCANSKEWALLCAMREHPDIRGIYCRESVIPCEEECVPPLPPLPPLPGGGMGWPD